MVALIAPTRFAFAATTPHLKTRTILKSARKKKALIWGSALLIAKMTKFARMHALTISKTSTKHALVRLFGIKF